MTKGAGLLTEVLVAIGTASLISNGHEADETVKNLQVKDCRGLASIAIPEIDEAEDVILNMHELSMADMKNPDYLARIKLRGESFILHMEFESNLSRAEA